MGSAALGQLLVWEWRSESYVLKQQVKARATTLWLGTPWDHTAIQNCAAVR